MANNTKNSKNNPKEEKPTCSFCGKKVSFEESAAAGIRKDAKGDAVIICEKCIRCYFTNMGLQDMFVKRQQLKKGIRGMRRRSLPHPSELKAHLDQYIEGQEEAKRILSVAVYNHYKAMRIRQCRTTAEKQTSVELEKSNIMLLGPSGCGKTAMLRALAKALHVPFTIVDITGYTQSGYVGKDVETIIRDLFQAANGDKQACESGIVYIDEMDKTSRKGPNVSTTGDPSHEAVQQALLKLLEGSEVDFPVSGMRMHPEARVVRINTENILFIVGGAFEGIEKIIARRKRKPSMDVPHIGIGAPLRERPKQNADEFNELIKDVTTEDLKNFGILPEILGRVPVICPMTALSEEELVHVLYRPKNAITKQYTELLAQDGIRLEFTDAALHAIAREAIVRKVGARGLRSIVEKYLKNIMYEAPDRKEKTVLVDAIDGIVRVNFIQEGTITNAGQPRENLSA